jgi:hypothetical protein
VAAFNRRAKDTVKISRGLLLDRTIFAVHLHESLTFVRLIVFEFPMSEPR